MQACVLSAIAQEGYKVVYNRIKHVPGIKKSEKDSTVFYEVKEQEYLLYCNDSMAYSFLHFPGREKNPYSKKDTVFGKKIIHHAIAHQRNSGYSYHYKAFPNRRKPSLLRRKEKPVTFVVQDSNVMVKGLPCYAGYFVINGNDTLQAVIAKDIPYPYGPWGYQGLPGLVIQVYWPRHKSLIKMESLEKKAVVKIELPGIPVIDTP